MSHYKICRICLRTEAKMYKFDIYQLKSYYEEVMALQVNDNDGLPQYFCYECAFMLHKFHKFKEKCYCGQKILRELHWRGPITYESVYKIDRESKSLRPHLQVMTITSRVKSFVLKEEEVETVIPENNKTNQIQIDCQIAEQNGVEMNTSLETLSLNQYSPSSPSFVMIDSKKEIIKLEREKIKERRKSKDTETGLKNRRTRLLDASNWVKVSLTEEEALKEFRAKADVPKYMKAHFKCSECFKGFSKEEMLKRHIHLRHAESLGSFECRFCRMRFKWDSHLRIHMRQHFTKYKCQRCDFICVLENSAFLHEEYHSGVMRKCLHCGEEFRHASTYYTHLRTSHRSEYLCTLCGVSFVSETGLHQHKRVKHVSTDTGFESPDDFEDANTHCEKCDITFETRKAYEEHLFHSVMHTEGLEKEVDDEITIPRKVLGKKMRAKIIKQIGKRKSDGDVFPAPDTKRKKRRAKTKRKKPTTCHQCGKHFNTQSECLKHHQAEHPRTCFYSPAQRYICEICGASLAPGSVAVHRNMHTKAIMFKCDTCGKQFHSSIGLTRHLVIHTGNKPFACSLCPKRFTQSNSMKLHYRTFHLHQPYPKRNRKKKTDDAQEAVDVQDTETDERSEDENLPEPDSMIEPRFEPVTSVILNEPMSEETVHYLTLN